jgi:hypothetical protein
VLGFLARRLLFAVGTLVLTAFFAYGTIRVLRPELYAGQELADGLWTDVTVSLDPRIRSRGRTVG